MKKIIKNLSLAILFVVVPMVFGSVNAASLKFDKETVTAANGATFQIGVMVEPESDSLSSADVYVTYDSALLKATVVTSGTQFPTVTNDIATSGKVYIAGMVNDPSASISTSGTLATITFQALKDGTGTLAFDCNLSKIIKNDVNATNVIVCGSNLTSAVTVGAGESGITTPTPTTTAVSELPQSGVFDNVVKLVIPGIILLLLGSIFRLVL